jgi:hypothetical protein
MLQVYMRTNSLEISQTTVEQWVEYLCEQGCVKVSGYIEALQNNSDLPELGRLSDVQRAAVLDELLSIMSVYDGKCSH